MCRISALFSGAPRSLLAGPDLCPQRSVLLILPSDVVGPILMFPNDTTDLIMVNGTLYLIVPNSIIR